MKDWRTWLILLLIAVVAVLAWFSCNKKTETVIVPDTQGSIDSLNGIRYSDSLELVWQRDSIDALKEQAEFERDMLTTQMLSDEGKIRYLNKVIQALKKDTGITVFELSCDSLSQVSGRLVLSNDSLRTLQAMIDELMKYEIAIRDTAIFYCDRGYLAAVDVALKANEAFSKYREQNKTRNEFYLGISGLYNPLTYGAGGSLMLKTKKDKLFGITYYITNGKPAYQAQALFKIKLKK